MDEKNQNRRAFIGSVAKGGALLGGAVGIGSLALSSRQPNEMASGISKELAHAIYSGNLRTAATIIGKSGVDLTSPISVDGSDPVPPIFLAIWSGNWWLLEFLREEEVKRGIIRDLTYCAPGELSIGMYTCGDWSMARTLVSCNIDLTARDKSGNQAFHWAFIKGSLIVAQVLFDQKCPLDDLDELGRTPLMLAVEWPEWVEILIKNGAHANGIDSNGWTPLAHAAKSGSVESVKLLLDAGAKPDLGTVFGKPLHEALHDPTFIRSAYAREQIIKLVCG